MDPFAWVKTNWKWVAVAAFVALISAWVFRPVILQREWGWIPVTFGFAAYFLAKKFVK